MTDHALSASFPNLRFSSPEPGVTHVLLDRPERRNALDRDLHRELADVWPALDRDTGTRVVVVSGAGGAFSAGGDLEMVETLLTDPVARAEVHREARDLVRNLIDCAVPVISAIEGPAVGAGLAVALLADVSVAARGAKLVDGHTRLGVAAGDHAAVVWPLLCGMAKAKYHLLTCEPISGEEAERLGMVSLVVDDGDALARALEVATTLAAMNPAALARTKHTLNHWLRQAMPAFEASLALEFLGFTEPAAREGVAAIREKRTPDFSDDRVRR